MKLSFDHLRSLSRFDKVIALNSYQLKLLGIAWPPKHGWVRHLVGTEITLETYQLLLDLKGTNKKERGRILAQHGMTSRGLFFGPSNHSQPSLPDFCI